MSISATLSNHAKYAFAKKMIDLSSDSLKVLLMRNGFVFDKTKHAKWINIHGTLTGTTLAIDSSKNLTDSANGLIAAGFVPGNQVTMSGWSASGDNVTKIIATVAAGTVTFTDTTGLVAEAAGNTVTVMANDELATGAGYTQNTKTLASQVLTEDNTNDRAEMTCANPLWTASGGDIGPTPSAIVMDDTSSDKTIIGELNFGGNQTASDGADFPISNIKIQLS